MNDTQSPIRFSAVPNNTLLLYAQGFCNETGLADFLHMPIEDYIVPMVYHNPHILTLWACKSLPTGEQDMHYYIYLRELGFYFGGGDLNISCTVSPIQPAMFPVTYQSSSHVFSTQEPSATSAPAINFNFIEQAILALNLAVYLAQTATVNLVADSIEALGAQAGQYEESGQYLLPLYKAMIQGILVDKVCTASNSSHPLLMVIQQLTSMWYSYSTASANDFSSSLPAWLGGEASAYQVFDANDNHQPFFLDHRVDLHNKG